MKPEARFYALSVSLTIGGMYALLSWLPVPQSLSATPWAMGLVGLLASVGVYKAISALLVESLKNVRWLKKLLLGPCFLEGTWVGILKGKGPDDGGSYDRIIIEDFEQSPFDIVIRGASFTGDGVLRASWWTPMMPLLCR